MSRQLSVPFAFSFNWNIICFTPNERQSSLKSSGANQTDMYTDELRVFLESGLVVTKTNPGVVNMQIMSLQNTEERQNFTGSQYGVNAPKQWKRGIFSGLGANGRLNYVAHYKIAMSGHIYWKQNELCKNVIYTWIWLKAESN